MYCEVLYIQRGSTVQEYLYFRDETIGRTAEMMRMPLVVFTLVHGPNLIEEGVQRGLPINTANIL